MSRYRRNARRIFSVGAPIILLLGALAVAITIGPAEITLAEVTESVWAHLRGIPSNLSPIRDAIIWQGRVPRVIAAAVVGGGLAACGAMMQTLTRNSLADPYLLGLSSGASTGAVLVIVLGVSVAVPVAAFCGAAFALVLTLTLTRAAGSASPMPIILAGLAVSAALSSVTSLIIFWHATGDGYREVLAWLLGSLGGIDWGDIAVATPVAFACMAVFLLRARTLDGFLLGDVSAAALGISVSRVRWFLLICVSLLTGALVAVSGSIGFVGLVVPHAVRLIVGAFHQRVLPYSFIAGAVFLVLADILSRALFAPREIPVGVITSLIGGPAFAVLLLRGSTALRRTRA